MPWQYSEVAKDLGVSHRIVLAQAALESGWGKSVKGNGLMGIKSHGEDGGLDVITHEVVNGKRVKITDSFRQYDSPEDSIRGYGSFLKANSRYKHFLRAGTENEDAQLSALQSSGYASDPKYAFKLRNIMNGLPDEQGETWSTASWHSQSSHSCTRISGCPNANSGALFGAVMIFSTSFSDGVNQSGALWAITLSMIVWLGAGLTRLRFLESFHPC